MTILGARLSFVVVRPGPAVPSLVLWEASKRFQAGNGIASDGLERLLPLCPVASCSVVITDALFYLFLLIPHFHHILRSLLLPGNKRDRNKTLTQRAEWSKFVVDYFVWQSDLLYWGFRLSKISLNDD